MNESDTKNTGRSEATRTQIIATAEQLFAEHGVEGVSLNTINQAAKQKNKNAVHYHFGNKLGLLQAIFDKHAQSIALRRQQLLDTLETRGNLGLRDLVSTLATPVAEKLLDTDGGTAYIHISSELTAPNILEFYQPSSYPLRINREVRLSQLIQEQLIELPTEIIQQRMTLIVGMLFHGLSDFARLHEKSPTEGLQKRNALITSNLIDSMTGALSCPVSEETLTALKAP